MRKNDEMKLLASCLGKAGDQEMLFTILSRDPAAPETIRFWCAKRIELGKNAPGDQQIKEALETADVMEREAGMYKPGATR